MKWTHNNEGETRANGSLSSPHPHGLDFVGRAAALALMVSFAMTGCGGDDDGPSGSDGGYRDATILDAGPTPDGSTIADGGVDAAADAGFVGCSREACDPTGDDCGDGGVCVLGSGEAMCVDSTTLGAGAKGEACETTTDCAHGLACVMRRDGAVCAELCCPDDSAECSDMADTCGGTGTLIDGTATDWWTCVGPRVCDVFEAEAACDPGEACYIVSASGETDCRRAGTLEVGETCATQRDCGAGLFCLIGAATPTCARICAIGAAAGDAHACSAAEGACMAYSYSPMGTGICTPPMM